MPTYTSDSNNDNLPSSSTRFLRPLLLAEAPPLKKVLARPVIPRLGMQRTKNDHAPLVVGRPLALVEQQQQKRSTTMMRNRFITHAAELRTSPSPRPLYTNTKSIQTLAQTMSSPTINIHLTHEHHSLLQRFTYLIVESLPTNLFPIMTFLTSRDDPIHLISLMRNRLTRLHLIKLIMSFDLEVRRSLSWS